MANKKKEQIPTKDFDSSLLPSTRFEQFKMLVKERFTTLISMGLTMFLFAIPLFFIYLIFALYKPQTYEDYFIANLVTDLCEIIGFAIFFLGLSGVNKIVKNLVFDEPIIYRDDLFKGIKENWTQYIGMSFFVSISILIFNAALNLANINNSEELQIGAYVLIGIFLFVFMAMFLMMIPMICIYKNPFKNNMKNAFIFLVRHFIPYILFDLGIIGVFILFVFLILSQQSIILILGIGAFLILYILPIFVLANFEYCVYVFDNYLNNDFKEIYKKGLNNENK